MSHFSTLLPFRTQSKQRGFTLIEILIAVVVVGLVLTAITSALTNSVKNAAESRYRTRAATLGQEAIEVLSRERTLLGWGEFVAIFPTGTTPYCFQLLPSAGTLRTWPSGACTTTQTIDEAGVVFTRQAEVIKSAVNPAEIVVNMNVKWIDGYRLPNVTLTRIYHKTDQ